MASGMPFAISVARSLVEVAGLCLLGQGVLWVLAGRSREQNPVYRLFRVITAPVIRLVRLASPKIVLDRHIPVVTFFLLFWLWILLAYVRQALCALGGPDCR